MSNLNLELSLLNSTYLDKLLKELKYILEQKRKLLVGIKSLKDFNNKLSFAEKGIYKSILERENEILKELLQIKAWEVDNSDPPSNSQFDDYDIYDSNSFINYS